MLSDGRWDWNELQRTAFEMGIQPRQFWRMTLRTFLLCFEGYEYRQRAEWRRTAWLAAYMINCWSTEKVTALQLLGEERQPQSFVDAEQFREHMRLRQRKEE